MLERSRQAFLYGVAGEQPSAPKKLMRRAGWLVGRERPAGGHDQRGAEQRRLIKSPPGDGFELAGRRASDVTLAALARRG